MGCSVTSVLSSRWRRGAKPLAVAAAAIEKTLRRSCSRLLRQRQGFERSNSLQCCGGWPLCFLIGHLQQKHGGLHEEDGEQCDRWSGLQIQQVPVSLFQKVQKTVEAQVQDICRIVDMTVCYNIKTAIQTVWNGGGTSDSVVIDWWTSLCDAKTGACVQWLDCSHEVSGFSGLCRSPGSASEKKKSTLGANQMDTCLENPGRVQ